MSDDETMATWTVGKKHIYRALRNLLVNEMGLTREVIEGHVIDYVKEHLNEFLHKRLQESWFVTMARNAVYAAAQEAVRHHMRFWGATVTFEVKPNPDGKSQP